jgi:NAD(P)-dependent dehydrogenase (short-subunit alcohol dehydrogenase family)
MYELSGKVALVTGAGGRRGIGRAIANRLAREGCDVAVNDILKRPDAVLPEDLAAGWQGLQSVVADIESLGRSALGVFADVSDREQVIDMVKQTLDRFRRIDIFVANAGSQPGRDRRLIVDLEEDAFDEVQRVNVKGTFLCCQEVARHMIARGGPGKIIIMSSRAGKQATARYGAYVASKFALIGLTQTLALELAPYRINVNAICPGLVDTERVLYMAEALRPQGVSTEDYRRQMLDERARDVPLGRAAVADDVARTAAFLASDESDDRPGYQRHRRWAHDVVLRSHSGRRTEG